MGFLLKFGDQKSDKGAGLFSGCDVTEKTDTLLWELLFYLVLQPAKKE